MYIAVCDDCEEELKALIDLLQLWKEERKAVVRFKTFRTTSELLDAARKESFTLYLMDIVLSGTNGFYLLNERFCV